MRTITPLIITWCLLLKQSLLQQPPAISSIRCNVGKPEDDAVPIRKINPSISPQLEEILRRALERNPIHRYGSAREFAHDLAHPDSIMISEAVVSKKNASRRSTDAATRNLLLYSLFLIPAILFLLMYLLYERR